MGVYDGKTVSVYVDGVKGGSTASLPNQVLDTSTGNFMIGNGTTGDVDSVRIYTDYPH